MFGPEHPHTLTSVSNLKSVLLSQGKYKEAEVITALAENGSYSRCYGRHRGHVTSRDQGSVYNFSRYCLPFPFLFFSFRSLFIDNPIIQAVYILLAMLMP